MLPKSEHLAREGYQMLPSPRAPQSKQKHMNRATLTGHANVTTGGELATVWTAESGCKPRRLLNYTYPPLGLERDV